ncbi:MAG: hypothetical protein HC900_08510 [Methylacidiphilales bacterium]|nr:hypothetical protein [Candidatus Methylacidiphilales bacterium]
MGNLEMADKAETYRRTLSLMAARCRPPGRLAKTLLAKTLLAKTLLAKNRLTMNQRRTARHGSAPSCLGEIPPGGATSSNTLKAGLDDGRFRLRTFL